MEPQNAQDSCSHEGTFYGVEPSSVVHYLDNLEGEIQICQVIIYMTELR